MAAENAGFAFVDGVDVYDLGCELRGLPTVFSHPPIAWSTVRTSERPGSTLSLEDPDIGDRAIVLNALGKFASVAAAETAIATLKDATVGGLRRISFAHSSGRSFYGVCESFPAEQVDPLGVPGWLNLPLGFRCPDPYAIDDDTIVVSGASGDRIPILVGTGPSYLEITIGPSTGAVVTLRDYRGVVVATIGLTSATIAAGDAWRISTLDGLSEKSVSSVWSSNTGDLTSTYTFPVALPSHANRAGTAWPTIEATAPINVRYGRRWA